MNRLDIENSTLFNRLPHESITNILGRVAADSPLDLFNCKLRLLLNKY